MVRFPFAREVWRRNGPLLNRYYLAQRLPQSTGPMRTRSLLLRARCSSGAVIVGVTAIDGGMTGGGRVPFCRCARIRSWLIPKCPEAQMHLNVLRNLEGREVVGDEEDDPQLLRHRQQSFQSERVESSPLHGRKGRPTQG
ncbi:unnamed protein product [Lampetra planeri]